ncbi:MAG: hypothetical protein EBV03_00005, partial [Proteobacteria bacterium]|nr:hypothetical protein [Pseudomonadota bacterium]
FDGNTLESAANFVDNQSRERFAIDMTRPLPEFNSEYAQGYEATDTMDNNSPCLAKICEPKHVQRYRVIERMQTIEHRAVLPLKGAGSVELTAGNVERFVVVYQRPAGQKLSQWVAQKRLSHSPHFLLEHVLIPIITGLEHFSALDISHGSINPDNIYFDGHTAVMGPCVSGPCGYNQPYYFESLERMQAHPCGKGEGSTAQDYYALAVTLLYLLHGPEHFAYFTQETLLTRMLKEGAYHALMRDKEVPEIFYDFLRGTLTQSPDERWTEKQLKSWLGGKRYNVLPPPPPTEAVRPFEFKEISVNNRRELAHMFASDWMGMLSALQTSSLAHWVTVSLRNKELAEMIARLCKSALDMHGKNDMHVAEVLSNIVLLLDQLGPLRIRQMSMNVEGIETMTAEMYRMNAATELQFLAKFVETNMINYWINLQTKRRPDFHLDERLNDLVHRLDRLRNCIRNSGHGFGLERMLYDLNTEMPCQSELFEGRYVRTLPQLLRALDRIAPTLEGDDIIDRHISAFIASKLQIQNEIRLNELSSMPLLATNRIMIALYLLALVQERVEPMRLPGLTHWFAVRLLPMMDSIHSKTLRQKMKNMLINIAPLGLTQKMAELMINADYAAADSGGFEKALATYRKNAAEIIKLKQPERLEYETHRMGLNLATTLAYSGLIFSVLYIIKGFTS